MQSNLCVECKNNKIVVRWVSSKKKSLVMYCYKCTHVNSVPVKRYQHLARSYETWGQFKKKNVLIIKDKIDSKNFYKSREWLELRFNTLIAYGRKCMCCFASNVELHVDHIVPVSKDPSKALDLNNLQVLCKACNLGKSNKSHADFR